MPKDAKGYDEVFYKDGAPTQNEPLEHPTEPVWYPPGYETYVPPQIVTTLPTFIKCGVCGALLIETDYTSRAKHDNFHKAIWELERRVL